MSGWYRLHRGWMDDPLFRGEPFNRRDAFLWLVEQAAFRRMPVMVSGKEIVLERGQLTYSTRYLAKAWKWDEKRVRRWLATAAASQKIAASTAAGQTLITICNYDDFQGLSDEGAAPPAASEAVNRRGGAANKKSLEEDKEIEEGGAAEAANRRYAFAGRTIRLNQRDFDTWRQTYHAIPDIAAELTSLDAWFEGQPEAKRKGWFHTTSGALNRKHQEILRANADRGEAWASPC